MHATANAVLGLAASIILMSCGTERGDDPGGAVGPGAGPHTGTGDGSDDDGSPDGDDDGSGGGGGDGGDDIKYDVAGGTGDEPGDGTARCEKVDFLFVVDNSPSMAGEQQNLIDSFPEFIDSIRIGAGLTDFRIMVIDPDRCNAERGQGFSPINCSPIQPDCYGPCCATLPAATCDGRQCPGCPSDSCEAGLGAGRLTDGNGTSCGIDSGQRYMLADQSNLEQTFACTARVGTTGNADERPMESLVEALSPSMIGPGGCNEGFVRDDALLVIVIIADEDDYPHSSEFGFMYPDYEYGSRGDPGTWYAAVVDAKGGQPGNAVVLALVGPKPPDDCPQNDNVDGADVATRILDFAQRFPASHVGPVCEANYKPFFDTAIGFVDQACDDFAPPG